MLKIYGVILEVVKELNPVIEMLERKDPDLARQCLRARSSMPLNCREGSHGQGRTRRARYSYVAGSADEIIAILDTGVAAGYFTEDSALREKLRHIIGCMRLVMKHG